MIVYGLFCFVSILRLADIANGNQLRNRVSNHQLKLNKSGIPHLNVKKIEKEIGTRRMPNAQWLNHNAIPYPLIRARSNSICESNALTG